MPYNTLSSHISNIIFTSLYHSPSGLLELGRLGDRLCMCDWVDSNPQRHQQILRRLCRKFGSKIMAEQKPSEVIVRAIMQLDEYFAGKRSIFDLPILTAGTPFQNAVWNELTKIPYGHTISYANLATRIGNPNAVRAVASANSANAISIILPCHRVIGSNGQLGGYAGGIEAKSALLRIEVSRKA